jgi:orotidine-5'-phosphate decarboxylase
MTFLGGADYIVVGRPTGTAPNPGAAAEDFQKRIADPSPGKPATA